MEEEIQKDIIQRVKKAKKITSPNDWEEERNKILGYDPEDIDDLIQSTIDDEVDSSELYNDFIEQEYAQQKKLYKLVNKEFTPYDQNDELQQLVTALIQQSNSELFNITNSLGFTVDLGNGQVKFTPLSEIYNKYLDHAILMMATGMYDYNTLIRRIVKDLTASGLRTVHYPSGYNNRVDVAARRALLTGMGQLAGQISKMHGRALGTDKYEVDWHNGARPDHKVWQGRVWTEQELEEVCGLGTGAGLLGWNCRHTYYPFLEGISVRNYTDEWLDEMNKKEAEKIPYKGKSYDAYEATQKQRQMETAMRAQRQKIKLMEEAGANPDDITTTKCKYQAMLDEYADFSKKFNLPQQRERIYQDLHGHTAPNWRTYRSWQGGDQQ